MATSEKWNAAQLVDPRDEQSFALGADNTHKLTDADIGKPLKIAASGNFATAVVCSSGDDIAYTLTALSAWTVNSGFSFGTINDRGYRYATVSSSTACPVGSLVVAGTQPANGTALATGPNGAQLIPIIKGTPALFNWIVVDCLGGVGAQNSTVVIKRV